MHSSMHIGVSEEIPLYSHSHVCDLSDMRPPPIDKIGHGPGYITNRILTSMRDRLRFTIKFDRLLEWS